MKKLLKTKVFMTLLLVVCACATAFAGEYKFTGAIGKYPIVFSFSATLASISGDYYYVSQGPDKTLHIEGELYTQNLDEYTDTWILTETLNGKKNGMFLMTWDRRTINSQKKMTGVYRTLKGKNYDVTLYMIE